MGKGGCNVTYVLLSHKVSVLLPSDCKQHLLILYCTGLHLMLLLSWVSIKICCNSKQLINSLIKLKNCIIIIIIILTAFLGQRLFLDTSLVV
jgi:hypothetical protein